MYIRYKLPRDLFLPSSGKQRPCGDGKAASFNKFLPDKRNKASTSLTDENAVRPAPEIARHGREHLRRDRDRGTSPSGRASSLALTTPLQDMTFDPVTQLYHYPCPCGDQFEIALADLQDGEEIAVCPSCSLMIRVIFDEGDLPGAEDGGAAQMVAVAG